MGEQIPTLLIDAAFRRIEQQCRPAVVKFFFPDYEKGAWTGFVVCKNPCIILSVAHAHSSTLTDRLSVKFFNNEEVHVANILRFDLKRDLSILHLLSKNPPVASVVTLSDHGGSLATSTSLICLGHPFAVENPWMGIRGTVCSELFHTRNNEIYDPDVSLFQHDAQVFTGWSGGPIVDLMGNVFGMQISETAHLEHVFCVDDFHRKAINQYVRQIVDQDGNTKTVKVNFNTYPKTIKELIFRPCHLKQAIFVKSIVETIEMWFGKDGFDISLDLNERIRQSIQKHLSTHGKLSAAEAKDFKTTVIKDRAGPSSSSSSRTTRASLIHQLQMIWDDIGESDTDRDNMLLQLDQEVLDTYQRKVDETGKHKADLLKWLEGAESEVTNIASSIGDTVMFSRGEGTLKQQLAKIKPVLEDLRSKKDEKFKEFLIIKSQISQICAEIDGCGQSVGVMDQDVDQCNLTTDKFRELISHLNELQNEKILRQQKVKNHILTISELSEIMSIDSWKTLNDIHPTLSDSSNGAPLSISNDTLASLTGVVHSLKQEKQERLQKIQELAKFLVELWDLMGMPIDEQKTFSHVTSLISASVDEVSIGGCLSDDIIKQVEVEVQHLNVLNVSKLKEIVFKRQSELEEIYRGVHMDVDSESARQILTSHIESGDVDISELLHNLDDQISKAKEQVLSRKDILDRVEKWKFAAEEEKWLDEYERDENRYSGVKGGYKNLKRAEKARTLVNEIQSMVENLTAKVKAWEVEKGIPFLYEKVPLLHSLDEYNAQWQLREEEKRKSRPREKKRLNEQHAVEQEAMFGSRSASKKPLSQSTHANTLVGTPTGRQMHTPSHTPSGRYGTSGAKDRRESGRVNNIIPVNYVALPKDDSVSRAS